MRLTRRVAVIGLGTVALAAAGCRDTQTRVDTAVTKEARTTTSSASRSTTRTGLTPAENGRECVIEAVGTVGRDPMRAMNECRDTLARVYGASSSNFAEAWQEVEATATCLMYNGSEACTTSGQ